MPVTDDAVAMLEIVEGIVVTDCRIATDVLRGLVERHFGDMVKYVVDVERRVVAVGGELHADGEALLLERGSAQSNVWGANYYPGRGRHGCIEYTALINIRPAQGNRGMEIQDPATRAKLEAITYGILGTGEAL